MLNYDDLIKEDFINPYATQRKRNELSSSGFSIQGKAPNILDKLDEAIMKPQQNSLQDKVNNYVDNRNKEVEKQKTYDQIKKEIGGLTTPISGLSSILQNMPFGERILNKIAPEGSLQKDIIDASQQENPKTAIASGLVGGIGSTMGLMPVLGGLAPIKNVDKLSGLAKIGASALNAGVEGTVVGTGLGASNYDTSKPIVENASDIAKQGLTMGAVSAGLGAGISGVGQLISKLRSGAKGISLSDSNVLSNIDDAYSTLKTNGVSSSTKVEVPEILNVPKFKPTETVKPITESNATPKIEVQPTKSQTINEPNFELQGEPYSIVGGQKITNNGSIVPNIEPKVEIKPIESIKSIDEIPNDIESLQKYVDDFQTLTNNKTPQQLKLMSMNLQLFAEAQKKLSKLRTNTLTKVEFLQEPMDQKILDDLDMSYDVKPNEQSIKRAQNMLTSDYQGTVNKLMNEGVNSAEETAASGIILRNMKEEAKQSGDYSVLGKFLTKIRPSFTKAGQTIQALATWNAKTTEGALMKAQKTVDKVADELEKVNPKLINKINDEADALKKVIIDGEKNSVNDIIDEIISSPDDIVSKAKGEKSSTTKQPNEEPLPEEVLAKRIVKTVNANDSINIKEKDVVKQMIDELYTKFKQTMPNDSILKTKPDKITEIADAIQNRRISAEVWNNAKSIVRDNFKDDSDALSILDDYFGKGNHPPFADNTLNGAINQGLKDLNLKIAQIVKDYYETGFNNRQKLVDYIVAKSGLSGEDAKVLADYIQSNIHNRISQYSRDYLQKIFSNEKLPNSVTDKVLRDIETLSNTGAFNNTLYAEKIMEKLSEKLRTAIRQSGVNMSDLVKEGVTATGIEKDRFVGNLMLKLGVNTRDAEYIASQAEKVFNEMANTSRSGMLKSKLGIGKTTTTPIKKTFVDKVMELINLGAYDDVAIKDIIKQKEGLPVLENDDIKAITQIMDKIQDLDPKSYDYRAGMSKVQQIIGSKIPTNAVGKFKALQRISMLSNTKTLAVRNPLSNLILGGLENTRTNLIGVPLDKLTTGIRKLAGNSEAERTYLFDPLMKTKEGLKGAGKAVKEWGKDVYNGVDTNPMENTDYMPKSKPFKEDGVANGYIGKLVT